MPTFDPELAYKLHNEAKAFGKHVRGVIFDMDGTLSVPGAIDFKRIRSRLQLAPEIDLIHAMQRDHVAKQVIEEEEFIGLYGSAFDHSHLSWEGTLNCTLQPGFSKLMHLLNDHKLQRAIVTRNSNRSVEAFFRKIYLDHRQEFFDNFFASHSSDLLDTMKSSAIEQASQQFDGRYCCDFFHIVLDRDSEVGFKPSPDPCLHISREWSLPPEHLIFFGDSHDDLMSALQAKMRFVLIANDHNRDIEPFAHAVCNDLHEAHELVSRWSKE